MGTTGQAPREDAKGAKKRKEKRGTGCQKIGGRFCAHPPIRVLGRIQMLNETAAEEGRG